MKIDNDDDNDDDDTHPAWIIVCDGKYSVADKNGLFRLEFESISGFLEGDSYQDVHDKYRCIEAQKQPQGTVKKASK